MPTTTRQEEAIPDLDPKSVLSGAARLAERFGDEAYYIALCVRSGLARPELPHRLARMLVAFERYGLLGGAVSAGAIRHGSRAAVIDELGSVTYRELDQNSNALANAWREHGLQPGEGVAILARDHRGFLESLFAAAKCGAKIILLNTSFAGPQIREVAGREGTDLLVFDDEYAELLEGVDPPRGRWRAWTEGETSPPDSTGALIAQASSKAPPKPGVTPRIIILTSGTTGTPKGAPRDVPKSLAPIGGLLSRVPFRARETTELCAPMFHALGFSSAMLAVAMGSTLVVRRRFDPSATLDSLERHGASAMVVVPVMLQRMLDLPQEQWAERSFPDLRVIFVSGSQLGAELCDRTMNAFGPVVYNLYGSTEVAYATIATPEDLAEEPSSVGKVVRGAVVKLLDDGGAPVVRTGQTGRIFVGNTIQFEGYTGGGSKEQLEGLMSSGDVGHFDAAGRLFIDGRDDEMIVSGGENVFPREIEELLERHPAVAEAAAVGVDDENFGQRLKAFVVLRGGESLSEDEVKRYVSENLARYKTPRDVVFLEALPRNQTGKVLKRELAEPS